MSAAHDDIPNGTGLRKLSIHTQAEPNLGSSPVPQSPANKLNKRRRRSSVKTPSAPRELITVEKKRRSNAPANIEFEINGKIKFSHLRELALFLLDASNELPGFIKVTNRSGVEKVVLIVVPCLSTPVLGVKTDQELKTHKLGDIPASLHFFKDQFEEARVTIAPGDKESIFPLMQAFTSRPLTRKEKLKMKQDLKEMKVTIPSLKLTLEDLTLNGYPIHPDTEGLDEEHRQGLPEGWIDTVKFEHEGSHTFAMDCEMCETAKGKVVTRVSIIDFNENVIMDEFVKPDEVITDYLTEFSGITEECLKGVETTLQDIQRKIKDTISSDDFLIGHSLENDLNVLKIRHPSILDTALIFEHPRGPPFKSSLKYLARQFLQKTIQEGSHDSVEDSKACLELVKLKLVEGGLLGKVIDGTPIFQDLEKVGKKACVVDYFRVQPNQDKYIQVTNDDEVVKQVISNIATKDLIVGNLKEIELSSEEQTQFYEKLNERLSKIYNALPSKTAFMIATGQSDPTELKALASQKRKYKNEFNNKLYSEIESKWDMDDDKLLKEAARVARIGVSFIKIKGDPNDIFEETAVE